jgi:crotonobetainyl-CoA:carnitine CoA-transferase CaiB-like acyl-CoA transferase
MPIWLGLSTKAGVLLADMGADVVMIGKPDGGDDARNGREHKSRKGRKPRASDARTVAVPIMGMEGHEEDL